MASYLQELLGDSYKEGMSLEEISNALQEKQVTLGDKAKDTSEVCSGCEKLPSAN